MGFFEVNWVICAAQKIEQQTNKTIKYKHLIMIMIMTNFNNQQPTTFFNLSNS